MAKILFEEGDWSLQKDSVDGYPIASIKHKCPMITHPYSMTLWFNGVRGITRCYCGTDTPENIQGLCCLYNLEWLGQRKDDA